MTRTEEDLRALLRTTVEPAASERVLSRVIGTSRRSRPSTWRSWRIGLVTALALVVVVGAVLAVVAARPGGRAAPQPPVASTPAPVSPSPSSSPPAVPAVVPVTSTLVTFPSGSSYQAGTSLLYVDDQTVDAFPIGGTAADASVHVGHYTAAALVPGRTPVDLGRGLVAQWVVSEAGASGAPDVPPALSWSVGRLTVTVEPPRVGGTDATVQAVARAVVIGTPVPVRVPVAVSSWPAGWVLDGLVSTYTSRDGATGAAGRDVLVDIGTAGDTSSTAVTIDSGGLAFAGGSDTAGVPVAIGGRTWFWDAGSSTFTWSGPDRFVRVSSLNGDVGRDDLQAVIAATTFATDFADESTWFDSTTAFPS